MKKRKGRRVSEEEKRESDSKKKKKKNSFSPVFFCFFFKKNCTSLLSFSSDATDLHCKNKGGCIIALLVFFFVSFKCIRG